MTALYAYEYRFTRHRIAEPAVPVTSSEEAVRYVRDAFDGAESERLVVMALDRKHKPIARETVYTGTVSGTSVRLAEVFRLAVRVNASAVILAHNHPSGDPTPSPDDIRTTRDAQAAGKLLGIEVLDHIVIGADRYHSIGDGTTRAIPHPEPFTTRERW